MMLNVAFMDSPNATLSGKKLLAKTVNVVNKSQLFFVRS
jgi:hypothetical protein